MRIALGADKHGTALKEELKNYLDRRQIAYEDFSEAADAPSDYAHIAERVCKALQAGQAQRGILVCGTGVGMNIAANKFAGIRAAVCTEPYSAILSRRQNNTNVLCLGARVLAGGLATLVLEGWLAAVFEGEPHQAALDTIARIEARNLPKPPQPPAPSPIPPDLELTRKLEDTRPTHL